MSGLGKNQKRMLAHTPEGRHTAKELWAMRLVVLDSTTAFRKLLRSLEANGLFSVTVCDDGEKRYELSADGRAIASTLNIPKPEPEKRRETHPGLLAMGSNRKAGRDQKKARAVEIAQKDPELSVAQISKRLGLTPAVVRAALRAAGIERDAVETILTREEHRKLRNTIPHQPANRFEEIWMRGPKGGGRG